MARRPKPPMGADPHSNLRALREWKGITLRELEEDLAKQFPTRIHNSTLSRMETGHRGIGMLSAKRLARYFHVRVTDLCTQPCDF